MSQSDYNIENADGATVRADINSQLEAIGSANSGSTAPPVTFPYMRWHDTASAQLKERNGANTAWIVVADILAGELVPHAAGESSDSRYARLSFSNTFTSGNEFSLMPTVGGDPVVESGSNSDGEWARWADGTQVVYGVESYTFSSATASSAATTSFPNTFFSPPRVVGSSEGGDANKILVASYFNNDGTTFQGIALNASGNTLNESRNVAYTAIGRWK